METIVSSYEPTMIKKKKWKHDGERNSGSSLHRKHLQILAQKNTKNAEGKVRGISTLLAVTH